MLTDEEAKALFEKVKDPKGWPLDDDDLDMVAGGRSIVTRPYIEGGLIDKKGNMIGY